MKLDLSKFKHLKSDDTHATLQHPAGHVITIAIGALSPEHKEAFKAMAKGGDVLASEEHNKGISTQGKDVRHARKAHHRGDKESHEIALDYAKEEAKGRAELERHNKPNIKGLAEGGKVDFYKTEHGKKALDLQHKAVENIKESFKKTYGEHGTHEITKPGHVRKKYEDGGEVLGHYDATTVYKSAQPQAQEVSHKKSPEELEAGRKQREKEEEQYKSQHSQPEAKEDMSGYKKYAEGGNVNPAKGLDFDAYAQERDKANFAVDHGLPCLNPNCKSHGRPHPNCRCYTGSGWNEMAKGGMVELPEGIDKHFCHAKLPHHPDCEMYAEGGTVNTLNYEEIRKRKKEMNHAESTKYKTPKKYAEGTTHVTDNGTVIQDAPEQAIPQEYQQSEVGQVPASLRAEEPQNQTQIQPQAQPQEQPQQGLAQQAQPMEEMKQPSVGPGYQSTMSAERPETSANPMERFHAQEQQNISNFEKDKSEAHQKLMEEDAHWSQDLANGHITPKTYQDLFHDRSTAGKIGTLFGLLLGGAGSGLTHQPNAVLAMMDKQIQNDLDAQIKSKENAKNFYNLAHQYVTSQSGAKLNDAQTRIQTQALSQIYANRAALHELVKKTESIPEGTPQRQQADLALGMLTQGLDSKLFNIKDQAAGMMAKASAFNPAGAAGGNDQNRQGMLRAFGPEGVARADYETSRSVPGVKGLATRDIRADERDKLSSMQILDDKVRDVLDFAKQHRGSINPQVIAQAKQKAHELAAFYNKSTDSLGMTPGRLDWLEKQIPRNPTSAFEQILGSNSSLREIRDSNTHRRDIMLSGPGGLGFPKQNQNMVNVVSPSGKQGQIPAGNLNKALKLGYKKAE